MLLIRLVVKAFIETLVRFEVRFGDARQLPEGAPRQRLVNEILSTRFQTLSVAHRLGEAIKPWLLSR